MTNSIILKNLTTQETININTDQGEYWLDTIDWGVVDGTNQTFKYVDQVGVYLYNTTLGSRQIMITGWVAGEDEQLVKRQKQFLNSLINPKHTLEVIRGQYKLTFVPETSVKYSTTYKENNEYMAKFLITGFCPYPLFVPLNPLGSKVSYTQGMLRFPLIIPQTKKMIMGIRQPSLIAVITNDGDFPVGYTIEFRAKGTVVNPKIIDIETQEYFLLNKTLSDGERVIVNTSEGERTVLGGLAEEPLTNYFQYRDYKSSWLSLGLGENHLRYDAEDGLSLLEIFITYSPGYLEVEE